MIAFLARTGKKILASDIDEIRPAVRRFLWQARARKNASRYLDQGTSTGEYLKEEVRRCGRKSTELESAWHSFSRKIREGEFFIREAESARLVEALHKVDGRASERIVDRADRVCDHRFEVFGKKDFRYDSVINWHLSPQNGREWPVVHSGNIEFKGSGRLGDIKYPWEIARHREFITLGKAFWITREKKYAEECRDQLWSFMAQNPPLVGIHWISPLEPAIRLISWVWGLAFLLESRCFDDAFTLPLAWFIQKQAEYVEANLETGRFANNHLIGQAAALVVAGMMFPGFSAAKSWVENGTRVLKQELFRQTYEDGCGVEQAFSYMRFNLDFLLQAFLLMEMGGIAVDRSVWSRLERIFEFFMHTMTPSGMGPNVGDSDGARGVFLTEEAYHDYKGILSVGAVLFGRGDFKYVSRRGSEELVWLRGAEGLEKYSRVDSFAPVQRSVSLPVGGYTVMRDHWDEDSNYLLMDHGPLGYGACAHGHADALSFVLHVKGQPVLIDPGTHNYNISLPLRRYFRSSLSHNTISIDTLDQADGNARMKWSSPYRACAERFLTTRNIDFVEGWHDGYMRLADPVRHRRRILYAKDCYWIIEDLVEGKARHRILSSYHLFPGIVPIEKEGKILLAEQGHRPLVLMEVLPTGFLKPVIYHGSDDPLGGYYSENYGELVSTYTVTFSNEVNLPAVSSTFVHPVPDNAAARPRLFAAGHPGLYMSRKGDQIDLICMESTDPRTNRGMDFQGDFLFARVHAGKGKGYVFADGAKGCTVNGETILDFDGGQGRVELGEGTSRTDRGNEHCVSRFAEFLEKELWPWLLSNPLS